MYTPGNTKLVFLDHEHFLEWLYDTDNLPGAKTNCKTCNYRNPKYQKLSDEPVHRCHSHFHIICAGSIKYQGA